MYPEVSVWGRQGQHFYCAAKAVDCVSYHILPRLRRRKNTREGKGMGYPIFGNVLVLEPLLPRTVYGYWLLYHLCIIGECVFTTRDGTALYLLRANGVFTFDCIVCSLCTLSDGKKVAQLIWNVDGCEVHIGVDNQHRYKLQVMDINLHLTFKAWTSRRCQLAESAL